MQEVETPADAKMQREVIIEAELEGQDLETKTELHSSGSSNQVYWLPNDRIAVYSAGESSVFTSLNTEPSRKAKFKGSVSFITGADEGEELDHV